MSSNIRTTQESCDLVITNILVHPELAPEQWRTTPQPRLSHAVDQEKATQFLEKLTLALD